MPIRNITGKVPATGQALDTLWAYASFSGFDFESKTARVVYTFYASKEAAYGGLPPLKTVEIPLGSTPTPAATVSTLVAPGSPAVYGEPDPQTGEAPLVTPAVDPVYETTEVYPEIPGLPQLIAANQPAYQALAASLDALALTLPEFAGGEVEPVPA